MDWVIKGIVIVISLSAFFKLLTSYFNSKDKLQKNTAKTPLLFTGFLSNIADTIGLGGFSVIVALNHRFKMVDEKKLPGTLNCQSIIPVMLQSLLFLNFIEMDYLLLTVFVIAACLGGLIGGYLISRLDRQTIRLMMSLGFFGIGLIVLAHQMHLLPIAGEATTLPYRKLIMGVPPMILIGMLPAVGVGMYVPIQVVFFLLGLSPIVAFPIMTTIGALVQSVTSYPFITKKEVAFEESLWLMLAGVVGVIIAVPLITYVNMETLRWLLLAIVFYNGSTMWLNYREEKVRVALTVPN